MVRDVFGLGTAIIVLAGIAFVIANSQGTGTVLDALSGGFARLVSSATNPGVSGT
jgi:hypothetical protein